MTVWFIYSTTRSQKLSVIVCMSNSQMPVLSL